MFQFKRYTKFLLAGIIAFGLGSCRDNTDFDSARAESQDFVVPEGMQKLTIRIPNYEGGAAQFGTRAYDPKEEGYMSNLYVVAIKCANVDEDGNIVIKVDQDGNIPAKDSEGETVDATIKYDTESAQWNMVNKSGDIIKENVKPGEYLLPDNERRLYTYSINSVGEDFKLVRENGETDYHTFNLALYPGLYRVGIIANADLYVWRTNKISDFKNEQDLRDLVLYFSEETPLAPMHLPMVCHPEEMKYQKGKEDFTGKVVYEDEQKVQEATNYVIPICQKYSTRIKSTLKFLCSKVRWTILFDKSEGGISEAYGNSWIRFNVDDRYKPIATKLRRYTKLFIDNEVEVQGGNDALFIKTATGASDENGVDGYTGSTYNATNGWWNMNIDRFYWLEEEGADYPLSPSSELKLWDKTTDEWIPSPQKVWQGIVYLPENLEVSNKDQNPYARTTVLEFPYHTRLNDNDDTPEVAADEPKRIYLFGNPNEKRYDVLNGGNYDLDNEISEVYKLERNYFYDVVAQVVNPDAEMDIRVFVSILPWHDIDQNVTESSTDKAPGNTNTIIDINTGVNEWNYEGSISPL